MEKEKVITFIPSNVHDGHYVEINGESTGIVVNLFAYQTIEDYKKEVDKKIETYEKHLHINQSDTDVLLNP